MEKALKKAIEGGYILPTHIKSSTEIFMSINGEEPKRYSIIYGDNILLDPLFWQSLGKQQEWGLVDSFYCGNKECKLYNDKGCSWTTRGYCRTCGVMQLQYSRQTDNPNWEFQWHRFIDHIAVGGSIDEFFNNLIK